MAGHDKHPEGAALEDAAAAAMVAAGERWTPMRAQVFAALRTTAGRPASAYDVAEQLSRQQARRVPANSVYRILDLFVRHNVARRVESANAYVVNAHPADRHDCMFLICDSCGSVQHVDDDRVSGSMRRAATSGGFRPERPVIEMHGKCGTCP